MNQSKISRKLRKCLLQLQKHDPDVELSSVPTKVIFVANSGPLCGLSYGELESIFNQFDENCDFIVFQSQRSYSFVIFQTVATAQLAYQKLHGQVPSKKENGLPFYIAFVKNVPAIKKAEPLHKPNGLSLLSDFINGNEEAALISVIEEYMPSRKTLKSHKVIHFGFEFNYDNNMPFEQPSSNPIPSACQSIIDRMLEAGIFRERPDQLTVNIYEPGNGIPPHVDTHSAFSDTIASLSLLSAKRKYDVNPKTNKLMRRQLRVSFTFRKVIQEKCQCEFIEYCDWDRNGAMKIPDNDEYGVSIEKQYVSTVYESIADHFDTTRHAQWNGVAKFLANFAPGTVVYDIGCGNGKYLKLNDDFIKIGCDSCNNLCRIANQKQCNVLRADILSLPFKSSSAGAVLCIAVIHHLSTKMRRFRAIQEIMRVLKTGGRACITVWAYEQNLCDGPSEYLKMRQKKRDVQTNRRDSRGRLRVHEGREFTQSDMLVPFQNADGSRFLRYYHLFRDFELEDLMHDVGGCVVEKYFYEQGNWIAYIKKEI
ncbi:unnamed protein product [Litomosoides sigmodontis]|uniref:RRM domain-containing protein n=1 Tax=Litomosoides sigmodontis TaxID=42156 RepID=A0A3P6V0A0_LITSI|nr:unnamed protein product [Litomosoides sigmodontis]